MFEFLDGRLSKCPAEKGFSSELKERMRKASEQLKQVVN